jgi:hypothetical protein
MTRRARRVLKSSLAGAYRHGASEGALGDCTRAVVWSATTVAAVQIFAQRPGQGDHILPRGEFLQVLRPICPKFNKNRIGL